MVVDRSHFEEPLSVGDLEIPDLKHNGERLNYVYDAAYDNYERISRHKCTSDRKSAEIKRTGIAHEHSCGIEVVDKKSRRRRDNKRRRHGQLAHIRKDKRAEGEEHADYKRDRAYKPVDTVGKVYRIDHSGKEDERKHIVKHSELKRHTDKRDIKLRRQIARCHHRGKVCAGCGKLEQILLRSGKPLVLRFAQLRRIVDHSDKSVGCGKEKRKQKCKMT